MSTSEAAALEEYIYSQFRNGIFYNLSTGIVYGMYFAMYWISVSVLLANGPLSRSRANTFMFCITTLMFVLGTVAIVLGPGLTLQIIPGVIRDFDSSFTGGWSNHTIDTVTSIFAVLIRFNVSSPLDPFRDDLVCAWRAVVLWRWDGKVLLILGTCILGTLVAAGIDLKLALEVHPGTGDERGLQQGTVAMVIVAPMLGTNILSTSLIAWKAWEYRRHVRANLRHGSPSQRVEKVLALLIESGFLYCLLWILYLLTAFKVLPGSGSYIVSVFMLYFSCMYPTIITIIVCLQARSSYEAYSDIAVPSNQVVLTTVHFAAIGSISSTHLETISEEGQPMNDIHERSFRGEGLAW
ncbi:hypothetical protein BC834DRAFT_1036326 [Gloeopeniophorella convolvens]|nr:hypothetical protein BC834DRAFT_1036326 [Gloeopeniophorella convolvens]